MEMARINMINSKTAREQMPRGALCNATQNLISNIPVITMLMKYFHWKKLLCKLDNSTKSGIWKKWERHTETVNLIGAIRNYKHAAAIFIVSTSIGGSSQSCTCVADIMTGQSCVHGDCYPLEWELLMFTQAAATWHNWFLKLSAAIL